MTAIFPFHDRKGKSIREYRLCILVDFNTRVTRAVVGVYGAGNSKTMCILVKENIALVFNELKGVVRKEQYARIGYKRTLHCFTTR